MKSMGVQSLPLHKPIILQKGSSLKQAAMAMKHNQVGSVLVTDGGGFLRGLFTDRDLALALALENVPASDKLSHVTKHALLYVPETATLSDVVELMKKFAIRRVPVVKTSPNGRQKCLGIITLDDLVKERLIDLDEEAEILRAQLIVPKKKMGRSHVKSIFHSQGRHEHSLFTFIKNVEANTGLNRAQARTLTQDVLIFILRRSSEEAGKKFLSQLPYELQMQLLLEVSPMDRSISGKLLLEHVQKKFSVKPDEAKILLQKFWKSLSQTVSAGELRNLNRELPKDMNKLFAEVPMA